MSGNGLLDESEPMRHVLDKLSNARRNGKGWIARCPSHDDKNPSLSISSADDGSVLLKCHAGCPTEVVVRALGLSMGDLFPPRAERRARRGRGEASPSKSLEHSNGSGCTLAAYAAVKRLPVDELRAFGLSQIAYCGAPAVRIPYCGPDGAELAIRFRIGLRKEDGERFKWKTGAKPCLYRLRRLEAARRERWTLLVEGESDCHTAWHHGLPAVGVPGANTWQDERDAPTFDGIDVIYAVIEPDRGGESLQGSLTESRLRDRVRILRLDGFEDLSALHMADPDAFSERLQAALDAAEPLAEILANAAKAEAVDALALSDGLLDDPNHLDRVRAAIVAGGYAGDTGPAQLAYLTFTSRLLDRPLNLAFVALSAAGKNYAITAGAELHPPEAIHWIDASSPRALIYDEASFEHRVVVVAEADSIPEDGPAAAAIRTIAAENVMRYDVVERDDRTGRHHTRRIEKPGPTGLVTTSTKSLATQLGTRVLEIAIPDTPAHTREILRAQAREAAGASPPPPDPSPFRAAQRWLELAGERRVTIPFAEPLSDLAPADQVRARRDFEKLLTAIKASAFLHQRQRDRAPDGSVIASLRDYSTAYELLAPVFTAIATEGLTPAIRSTVEAIRSGHEVSLRELATQLGVAPSTASWRVSRAIDGGWIINEEKQRGRPLRLKRGQPLPDETSALPSPDALREAFECSNDLGRDMSPSPSEGASNPLSHDAASVDAADSRDRVAVPTQTGGLAGADFEAIGPIFEADV